MMPQSDHIIPYTYNYALEEMDVIECTAKSYGYFPQKKSRERLWIVLKGKDVFVRLPIVFGKSACYKILPKTFDLIMELHQGQ